MGDGGGHLLAPDIGNAVQRKADKQLIRAAQIRLAVLDDEARKLAVLGEEDGHEQVALEG